MATEATSFTVKYETEGATLSWGSTETTNLLNWLVEVKSSASGSWTKLPLIDPATTTVSVKPVSVGEASFRVWAVVKQFAKESKGTITAPTPVLSTEAPVLSFANGVLSWTVPAGAKSFNLAVVHNPTTTRNTTYQIVTGSSITLTAAPGETVNYGLQVLTPSRGPWAKEVIISWPSETKPVPKEEANEVPVPQPGKEAWLGLNTNSAGAYLGKIDDFSKYGVVYDRSANLEWQAGETDNAGLATSLNAGMLPVVILKGEGASYGANCVKSIKAAEVAFPGAKIKWSLWNEPWEKISTAQYAQYAASALEKIALAGIDLSTVYVCGWGEQWHKDLYAAQPVLKTLVAGWDFHPYGPVSGPAESGKKVANGGANSYGINGPANVRKLLTSGQNNIIFSEVGRWAADVNGGASKGGLASFNDANSTIASANLTTLLQACATFRKEGWLKAVVLYSRNDGGWAMETAGSKLTAQGQTLINFSRENS